MVLHVGEGGGSRKGGRVLIALPEAFSKVETVN